MSTKIEEEKKPVPDKPTDSPQKEIKKERTAFTLKYRIRQIEGICNFWMPTPDLSKAIERGRKHCEVQNYKFIYVHYFFKDLDEEDAKRRQYDMS